MVFITKGQQIAEVSAANQVPNMLAPKHVDPTSKDSINMATDKMPHERFQKDWNQIVKLWEQLDVTGSHSWADNQKSEIK